MARIKAHLSPRKSPTLIVRDTISCVNHAVSNRPIWLIDAAVPPRPRRSTMARIAGSTERRSASFTSS
jgi:hypothetical protein